VPPRRRLEADLGWEHPTSLWAAVHLAAVLQARALARAERCATGAGGSGREQGSSSSAAAAEQWAAAERGFRRAHDAQRRVLGESHPDTLESAWRLGELLARRGAAAAPGLDVGESGGSAAEAVTLLRHAAERQAEVLGGDHHRTLRSRLSLAEAMLAAEGGSGRGGPAAAASTIAGVLEGLEAALDAKHPAIARAREVASRLGGAAAALDELAAAPEGFDAQALLDDVQSKNPHAAVLALLPRGGCEDPIGPTTSPAGLGVSSAAVEQLNAAFFSGEEAGAIALCGRELRVTERVEDGAHFLVVLASADGGGGYAEYTQRGVLLALYDAGMNAAIARQLATGVQEYVVGEGG
jgi:hypothetical protein